MIDAGSKQFAVQDDIATNTSVVDGRLSLAPVMSKKELRQGFAISAAVPFVKAGTLKVRKLNSELGFCLLAFVFSDRWSGG